MGIAADRYARITRQQYDDWYRRFYPEQKKLMEQSQSGELLSEQLGRVDENVDSAAQAAEAGQTNRMARYGVTAEEDPNQDAKLALSKVSAKNGLRTYERDRSMKTLSGSSMGLRNAPQHQQG
ncbi:hypothetical protein [Salinivibrio sp. KP-1]|uniref:hypothetical protein n=1 Tax=Salinivibrio sp. KP-1 TaxID=1406902 RepID=UPI00061450BF|nr:hypothetical protein [Salinivibrio sp. KP-1]KKA43423.1 hypothetical protein WN56_13625 [Salinivibrio sp. KP-1]